jgi:hypothetical protein
MDPFVQTLGGLDIYAPLGVPVGLRVGGFFTTN